MTEITLELLIDNELVNVIGLNEDTQLNGETDFILEVEYQEIHDILEPMIADYLYGDSSEIDIGLLENLVHHIDSLDEIDCMRLVAYYAEYFTQESIKDLIGIDLELFTIYSEDSKEKAMQSVIFEKFPFLNAHGIRSCIDFEKLYHHQGYATIQTATLNNEHFFYTTE